MTTQIRISLSSQKNIVESSTLSAVERELETARGLRCYTMPPDAMKRKEDFLHWWRSIGIELFDAMQSVSKP